ncbi:oxidoreductase [Candidatus Woesearchaeota archaeon]|nr:oxidoreductase [Candidatus Woesearchaeota archaeon]
MDEETINAEVINIIDETPDVKTFRLQPEHKLDFIPGQFVNIYVNIGKLVKRSYSIASSPSKEYIDLTIKKVQGGKLSPHMHDKVKIGDKINISYPEGRFTFSEEDTNLVFVSAGCGIVPFMSIMRYSTEKKLNQKIILLYSSKTAQDIVYREELKSLEKENSNIKVFHTITREEWDGHTGRIDEAFIKETVGDIQKSTFYLCGSLEFVRTLVEILKEMGVQREKIKRDVWV